jgi:hypothetical protein
MKHTITFCLSILVMSAAVASCKTNENGPISDAGDSDQGNDTTQGTDSSGPINSDEASSDPADSDTINSIFDTIDCAGLGADPARCEYEWCMLKQTYELELTSCAASPSTQCLQYIECYDNFFDCMGSACPLGNLVPASKNQIDVCKNTFTYCTLALEST